MVTGLWGKKIGMTQVFSNKNTVVPATVVDISGWYVTNIKTKERDGYNAVQVGCVRNRYLEKKFDINWIKKPKEYFLFIREVKLNKNISEMENPLIIGQTADFRSILEEGSSVDVFGTNKGCGFAGVVRRHGFRGGAASHGDTMGRAPGSIGSYCTQGRVIKGKKMPGHMGNRSHAVQNIEIIEVKKDSPIVVLKGSIPGRSRSLVYLRTEKVI